METGQQQINVSDIIADILSVRILRIRNAGFAGDAELCAIEADQAHE